MQRKWMAGETEHKAGRTRSLLAPVLLLLPCPEGPNAGH